jgi:hypothetical protein
LLGNPAHDIRARRLTRFWVCSHGPPRRHSRQETSGPSVSRQPITLHHATPYGTSCRIEHTIPDDRFGS